MSEANEKVLTKIKKLLAMASDERGNENERDNAMRQVQAMLAAHNLEIADIEAHGGTTEEARGRVTTEFFGRPWARRVCHAAAKLLFCDYIYTGNSDAKRIKHQFIGRKSNTISASELSKYLVESILKESSTQARSQGEPSGGSWARDFAKGASSAIQARVNEIIKTSTTPAAASPGTSLVLASLYQREREANALVVADLYPKLNRGRSGLGTSSSEATTRGRAYGNTVSLNKQVGGSSQKRLA